MTISSPYTITEPLSHGGRATLYRAVRSADRSQVILKVLDPRNSRPKDLEHLKHEYEIGKLLDTEAAVKPLALETYQSMPALVLKDFGGRTLDDLLLTPMSLDRFLPLAVRITAAVAAIHRLGIVHKDLKPANILFNAGSGEVKITDFGLASRLPREPPIASPPRLIEGSLPYLAPEQTGRTNRAIDERADLYSLGVTFYRMLTGRLPFEARDPVEWIHCHVARAPPSPTELVPKLPETIARIVLKLLAKMPEDRYQSARGLGRDLERCLEEWRVRGRIEPFPLGKDDTIGRLQIPQRHYGREAEINSLLQAFGRVVATGTPELLLVSGSSGIGKTTLVRELYKPIVRQGGFFIAGKFDPYKRNIPYSTIVQAFRELVLEILSDSDERIAAWRKRLLAALGINGQLIVEVIPPVELVIGPQPPPLELPPIEAQNRFRTVFRSFIGVFAQREHPLTLFLDDLQWADSASLGFVADLLGHPEMHHVLILGAYRDNEVTSSHPLLRMLDEVRKAGALVSNIVLGPIPHAELASFVGEALHATVEEAAPLSDLVYDKTGGNPFFATQFLAALNEEGLIELDGRTGAFRWDVAKIHAKGFTDNVIDLMVGKLQRLPAVTQEALKQLACVGNTGEVALLAMLHGGPEHGTHEGLWEAVHAGLVSRSDGTYKFLHDRIHEAAYSLIPEGERAAMHLEIGRLLASHTAPGEIEEKVFEIVNQLDLGAALITSQEERERVAAWNLLAGKRAKGSTAYASALNYFAAGTALLAEDRWERRYELTFTLELQRAECEYMTGEMVAAEERLSMLSCRAKNLIDVAAVTRARVALHTNLDQADRAVEACLEYLRRIGVQWSAHPTDEEVRQEYERVWQQLGSRSIEAIVDLPPLTDPVVRATMDVLTESEPPSLYTDENLHELLVARIANLSLEHGNSDGSCVGYVWLGVVLGSHFGDYTTGFRFGKLGFDLVDQRRLLRFKARVQLCFGMFISPWTRHFSASIEPVRRAFDTAEETGDLPFAAYACTSLISLLLENGAPLGEIQRAAERGLAFARKAKFGLVVDISKSRLQLIRMLRGLTPDFDSLNDAEFDEGAVERHLEGDPRLAFAACMHWIRKLQARVYAGDYVAAVRAASKAQALLWTSRAFVEVSEYHFFGALARAARYDAAPSSEQPEHLRALVAHHEELDKWAQNCPENFRARAALAAAEIARIQGETERAAQLYEEAIRGARDNDFVHSEAIAYETAARFYRARGFELIADTYLREARARYLRWGADGKVLALERLHPRLAPNEPIGPAGTVALRAEQLDLLSVTKASQTISSEIVLDRLVRTLLEVVLEQGGAQRACLLRCRDKILWIEAEAAVGERGATIVLASAPADDSQRVPTSLIHYVLRTKDRVILGDAAAHAGKFSADEYFARHASKSVLCVPIQRQAEVVGLLYLENDLLTGAFTPDRLAALELLATQAAISLENALLLAKEQAARAAAEDAEHRSAFIAEAGALLSESLDYEETLARLSRLCVRSLADWCAIDILKGQEIRRLSWAHADPEKEPLLQELQRRYPPSWDSPHLAVEVLRSGEARLIADLPDDVLRSRFKNDDHTRLLRALGARSALSVPLTARGQTLGVLSLSSGAPERRYGQADLELVEEVARRAAAAIDNARLYRASQEAVRLRSEFLMVASHELNTPMTSLMLAVQTLERAASSERPLDSQTTGRLLALVSRQAKRMARLVSDLLDVSRIEAGGLSLELADVDLGTLVHEVVDRLSPDLASAQCPVSIRNGTPAVGRWDRSRIDQVVTNLLSNAIKFGAGKPVKISLDTEDGVARLMIQDHGIGIDPEQQDRIFGRFERAVSERHFGGLGLGLYISRRIVQDHGGSIRCESRTGEGTTFIVELPLQRTTRRIDLDRMDQ